MGRFVEEGFEPERIGFLAAVASAAAFSAALFSAASFAAAFAAGVLRFPLGFIFAIIHQTLLAQWS